MPITMQVLDHRDSRNSSQYTFTGTSRIIEVTAVVYLFLGTGGLLENNLDFTLTNIVSFDTSFSIDMTMSLYLFLDMYLHSGEYHVGTVGIDIRNYIFAVLMR